MEGERERESEKREGERGKRREGKKMLRTKERLMEGEEEEEGGPLSTHGPNCFV